MNGNLTILQVIGLLAFAGVFVALGGMIVELVSTPHDIQITTLTVAGKSYAGGGTEGIQPIILDDKGDRWTVGQTAYMVMEINRTYHVKYFMANPSSIYKGSILSAEEGAK